MRGMCREEKEDVVVSCDLAKNVGILMQTNIKEEFLSIIPGLYQHTNISAECSVSLMRSSRSTSIRLLPDTMIIHI